QFTALDSCGPTWWSSGSTRETAQYNVLVQGGRCRNELPTEYRTGPGLDVDIPSCYWTVQAGLAFPVGLPTVWSFGPNNRRAPPGTWLDKTEPRLVPGLWTATISSEEPLPFAQDLFYSKLVKPRDLSKPTSHDADVPSDFVLLQKQLKNSILTA